MISRKPKLSLLRLAGAWKAFVTGKYRRKRYYFNHLEFLVQLSVLSLNQFAPITIGRCVTLSLVLLTVLILFVKLRPFTKELRCVDPLAHCGGPMEPSDGRLHTERLVFKPKVDVLSARGVALLCDLGATLEHRAHRRIRCPPTREVLVSGGLGLRGSGFRGFGFRFRGHG